MNTRWLSGLLEQLWKIPILISAFGVDFSKKLLDVSHQTKIRMSSPVLQDTTLRNAISLACLCYLIALLYVFPGDATQGLLSAVKPRNAEASEEAPFPDLVQSAGYHPPEQVSARVLLGNSLLQESCQSVRGRTVSEASLHMWYTMQHTYQHDLYVTKTPSTVKLTTAIVSNDSACQDCIIALFYYVLWFCLSSSRLYFLTTLMWSILMFLCFCLQPSDQHLLFFTSPVLPACCFSHLLHLKHFLPASLFISCLQVPYTGRGIHKLLTPSKNTINLDNVVGFF